MLKKILIGLLVVLGGLAAVIAMQPATYHVERSAVVPGGPGVAFAVINDFHRWGEWSPWDELDPAMKKTYEGPATGVGAKYAWAGNSDVGEGTMTITKAEPGQKIDMDLNFLKPMASSSKTSFTFAKADSGTKVTWAMDGDNDFMGKAFSLFMNMDKMIGDDFDKGLKKLGGLTEAEVKRQAAEDAAKAEAEAAAAAAAAEGDEGGADEGEVTD